MSLQVFKDGFRELFEKLDTWVIAIIKALPNIIIAVLVFSAFFYLSKVVFRLMKRFFSRTHINSNLENILASVMRWVVLMIGVVMALSILELDKTVFSMLAGVGVVGLALGFALKDIAANFIAGVMLAIRAPLRINDMIKIKDITGTVVDIRLRDTIVRTSDGLHAVIPNNTFTDNPMLNFNTYGLRKAIVEVALSYNNDPKQVKTALLNAVKAIDSKLSGREPLVAATAMNANGITYSAEMWIKYPREDWGERMDQLIIAVDNAVEESNFQRPYFSGSADFSKSLLAFTQKGFDHKNAIEN